MADSPFNSFDRSAPRATEPDPLSDALEYLVPHSWIPGRFELTAPWGIHVATHLGWFYLIMQSPCLVEVDGRDSPVSVAVGDLIIVSQGCLHRLQDKADSPTTPVQSLLKPRHFERREPLVHGGGGALTRLFCGCFLLDGLERSPLHAALPVVMHVRGERQQALPYVDHILRLLELEATEKEPGAQIIMNRLVRILLMKAVQGCTLELLHGNANWLRALADAEIGRALGLMHAQPDGRWTVASLAERVAMTRSTFSARFTEMVGQPPLEYLTQWRMQKACFLLRTTRAELKEVAAQVGYESNSAFSKAFTRWVGAAPGAYRRGGDTAAVSPRACLPPI